MKSVLTEAPLFSLKKSGCCVWLRGSGRVHTNPPEDGTSEVWPFACEVWTLIWNWKRFRGFLSETAPCNPGDVRRITQINWEALKHPISEVSVCVQDYVGFCVQLILFGLCVWQNFRKGSLPRDACEAWMLLVFLTFLMMKPIGITHLVVFTSSDEPNFGYQEVFKLGHLTKT